MTKRILPLSLIFLLSLLNIAKLCAQDARNYQFTTDETDELVDMSSGTTQLIGANQVNVSSTVTAIGFDVWFMGVRYTDFSVNANGVFQFGTSQIVTTGNTHSITGAPRVSPFSSGSLLSDANPISGAFATAPGTGEVHYKIEGVSPNRILVVEWADMEIGHRSQITDYATFQAHIYETSPPPTNTRGGVIRFIYGEMPSDARNASNTQIDIATRTGIGTGVNIGEYLSVITDAAPDTTTDDNGASASSAYENVLLSNENVPNLHTTVSTARRFFDFEAPDLDGQATTATLECSGPTQVALSWSENASNELGSVIFKSEDSVTFTFLTQTAQGVTDFVDNAVLPNTTYYYQFYLVNEGKLSELAGTGEITVTTPTAASIYAVQDGDWDDPDTWSSVNAPTAVDDVVIGCNYTVTVNAAGSACDDLTVLLGATLNFNNSIDLDINGNLDNGGTFDLGGEFITLNLGGNLTNTGVWSPGESDITLDGTALQTIENTGTSTLTSGIQADVTITAASSGNDAVGEDDFNTGTCSVFNAGLYSFFTGGSFASRTLSVPATGVYNAVKSITVSVENTQNSDVQIWLQQDGGSLSLLANDAGGDSDNYDNVSFTDNAANPITSAAPGDGNPITGSFRPESIAGGNSCSVSIAGLSAANSTSYTLYIDDQESDGTSGNLTLFEIVLDSGSITTTTYSDIAFYNVIINNTSAAGVVSNDTMRVSNNMTLTDGVIYTDHEVIFFDNATSDLGSNATHVDGVVRKIGDDAFDFPVGDDNFIANFGISAPAADTDEFTARYFRVNPADDGFNPFSIGSGIYNVSLVEYWQIDRPVGSSSVSLSASYEDTRSAGATVEADLRIVHWSGTQWETEGNSGSSANFTGIVSDNPVSTFSPFTLGNVNFNNPNPNPLPVSLLNFDAKRMEAAVQLDWTTASELNSDYFEIERSIDGVHFNSIGTVAAAGESSALREYRFLDMEAGEAQVEQLYYRLRMVDRDETFEHSKTKRVFFEIDNFDLVNAYPNPVKSDLTIEFVAPYEGNVQLVLIDVLGRTVHNSTHQAKKGLNEVFWNEKMNSLPNGTYILVAQFGTERITKRLLK